MEDNPFVTETYQRKLQRAGLDPDLGHDFNNDGDEQEFSDGSDCSESSSEEHAAVEDSVREDMVKLEQTFKGMGLKYRMIDRIGEGDALDDASARQIIADKFRLYRHLLNRLQSRRLALPILSERLGH